MAAPSSHATSAEPAAPAPTLALMHATSLLTGLATMLLGPILPLLSARWHLTDAHAGLLLTAQFIGATLGGASVPRRLQRGLLTGYLGAAVGFLAFAWAPALPWAAAALLLAGFGVGRLIAGMNITAGARYTHARASALTWLNTSWSLGALLSPIAAATLAGRIALPWLLSAFALLYLAAGLIFAAQTRTRSPNLETIQTVAPQIFPASLFLYFATLLLLYGGLETCLSGWLTTYALRDGRSSLVLSQYTMVLLLAGLTGGRALAANLLKVIPETTLLRSALLLSAGLAAALAAAHRAALIATLAVLLGIALAPVFPGMFALFMAHRPPTRHAGLVIAASGIGAAVFPALMGLVSTRAGSLRVALAVPASLAVVILLLSLSRSAKAAPISEALPSV